jgi:hypothetical protein
LDVPVLADLDGVGLAEAALTTLDDVVGFFDFENSFFLRVFMLRRRRRGPAAMKTPAKRG